MYLPGRAVVSCVANKLSRHSGVVVVSIKSSRGCSVFHHGIGLVVVAVTVQRGWDPQIGRTFTAAINGPFPVSTPLWLWALQR